MRRPHAPIPTEEEVVVEEFSSDDSAAPPLSPPPSSLRRSAPNRPVPIPPGKTEEDFSFLFKKEPVITSPSERLRTVRAKNKVRMSVMLHKPLEADVKDTIVSPRAGGQDGEVSPRMSMVSPRMSSRGKLSKSERVKDVMARVAALQQENVAAWNDLPVPVAPAVQREIDEAVAGRGDWYELVEGLDVPTLWLLVAGLLRSFPNKDVLLTPTLRELFVAAAADESSIHRRLSFHALFFSLPEQNSQLLTAVLAALKSLSVPQLHLVSRLVGPLMGGEAVVEALTSEFPLNGDFCGVLTIMERNHWVSTVSRDALLHVVFNEAYELLEPDFLEMVLMTTRCFMTESALIGMLKDRYESLLQSKSANALAHRRSLLLFVHQLLLSRESHLWPPFFGEALASLKLVLREEGNEDNLVHCDFILRFVPAVAPASSSTPPMVKSPRIIALLSFPIAVWTSALTVVASELFSKISTQDFMRRGWETCESFRGMRDFFNHLQTFVAASILEPEDRGEMLISLENCILIASNLVAVRNFHAAFAVYAGLSMASVSRLKMLWEKVPAKTASLMDDLTSLFDPSKNHLNYQRALDSTPDDAPVVPNMVVILKWLFTIEEVNPTLTSSGNVNLEKMRMLFVIASKIDALQAHPPLVCSVPGELLSFVRHLATSSSSNFKTEAALFDLSLARLPRAADGQSLQRMSLRSQVNAAMIRARTDRKVDGTTSRGSNSNTALNATSPDSEKSPPVLGRSSLGGRSASISRSSELAKEKDKADKEKAALEKPSAVLVRGMVCPICMKSFLDKSDLLEHIEENACKKE